MPELLDDPVIDALRRYGAAVDEAAARFGTPVAAYPGSPSAEVTAPGDVTGAPPGSRRRRPLVLVAAAVLALVVATVVLVRRDEGSSPVVDTPTTTVTMPVGEPFEDGTVLLWLPYEGPPQFLYAGSDRPAPLLIGDPPQPGRSFIATVNTTAGFLVQGSLFLVDRAGTVTPTGLPADRVLADREAGVFYIYVSSVLYRYDPSVVDADGNRPAWGSLGGWQLPRGWRLANDGVGVDVVDGRVILESTDPTSADQDLAVWTPTTGDLVPLGRARWVVDATGYGGSPKVAWVDDDCDRASTGCGLVITDLDTMESRTVARAPWGYIGGGAFSDDGRRLAVFAAGQENMPVDPSADLAVINVDTLEMRVVPGTNVPVGEPYGSAVWTFDGRSVIFHGLSETHVVDVDTGAIRTLPWEVTYGMATIP